MFLREEEGRDRAMGAGGKKFAVTVLESQEPNVRIVSPETSIVHMSKILSYVEALESRVKKMENFIRQFKEDAPSGTSLNNASEAQREKFFDACISLMAQWDADLPETQGDKDLWEEETAELEFSGKLAKTYEGGRFLGRSSEVMLIRTVVDYKTGRPMDLLEVSPSMLGRPEYWEPGPWETVPSQFASFSFPSEDLLRDLTEIYFKNINILLPLLHRPTFERQVNGGLHNENSMFGAVVLLLSAMYLRGSWSPQSTWNVAGVGVRLAVDIGAHRRPVSERPTVEDELLKRAFWTLLCMDISSSATLGKPVAIHDEDFDQLLPVECDDEYWENPDPELAFKQPPGTTSSVTYFNCLIKLMRLLSMVLRIIYTSRKHELISGFTGPQWEQRAVAMFDSSLNQWVESLPPHLRWDPGRKDDVFFNQSAMLYTHYYQLQIFVHRPFIAPNKQRSVTFPSLAICTNAARSCSHVVEVLRRRKGFALPFTVAPAFTCGIILLLNIWGGKRSGWSSDPDKEMAEVHKCMKAARDCEERWYGAGQMWDIMFQLASVGELPVPARSPSSVLSDELGDSPKSGTSNSPTMMTQGIFTSSPIPSSSIPHDPNATPTIRSHSSPMADPAHMNSHFASRSQASQGFEHQQYFSLPMRSDELGRLPVHGQLNYASGAPSNQPGQTKLDQGGGSGGPSYWFTPMCTPGGSDPMENVFASEASVLINDLGLPVNYPNLVDVDFFGGSFANGSGSEGGTGHMAGAYQHQHQQHPQHQPQYQHQQNQSHQHYHRHQQPVSSPNSGSWPGPSQSASTSTPPGYM
ncbi:Gypsy retrotransposon integrase-like protein 1 [Marasmius crinis-equi]|uniref:Gypsy retrotransposon integrase-like protein 1 n=1 Tax=Marasmius crinis-equi TaxID=585013 RepID=A0ABR3FLP3_9AGAR